MRQSFIESVLLATYVDVTVDGTVSAPSQVVGKGRVDEILSLLQRELNFCESVVAQATPSQFAAALESMPTSTVGQDVRQVFNEGGPEAAMAFVICARAGMPYDLALEASLNRPKIFFVAPAETMSNSPFGFIDRVPSNSDTAAG